MSTASSLVNDLDFGTGIPQLPAAQITLFRRGHDIHPDAPGADHIGGYACACSTQINYVSLLLDRLLRPVRAAARTRSQCLAQVRHPQDSGIL